MVRAVQGKSSNAITYQSVRNKALCVKSKHFVCRVLIGFPIAQEVLHWQPTTPTLHVRPTAHAANANNMTNNSCLTCSRPQHWHVSALCASFPPPKTYFLLFQKFLCLSLLTEVPKKECLAIQWGVDSVRYYLLGCPFTLCSFHAPLQWFHNMKDANAWINC